MANIHNTDINQREVATRALLRLVLAINDEIMNWHKLNEIKHKKQSDYDSMDACIRHVNNHANDARSQIPTFGLMGVPKINTLFLQFCDAMKKNNNNGDVFAAHKILAQIEDVLLDIDY